MSSSENPVKAEAIAPEFHQRIWGAKNLDPWFPKQVENIGEVWFRQPESPVLVKFLFATENLSVQVHPNDSMALQSGHLRGKTEMWHILKAEQGARIALGFKTAVTRDQVRLASMDGSIVDMLRWIPVAPGQSWFIPAGVVHAIGAGVTLCEVQQNSDLTYRLYDFGRGRELHLEESLQAADLSFEAAAPVTEAGLQIDCPYFQVSRIDLKGECVAGPTSLAIALSGSAQVLGRTIRAGEVVSFPRAEPIQCTGHARLLTVLTRT